MVCNCTRESIINKDEQKKSVSVVPSSVYICGRNQVRPYTTVDMIDKLGTFAGQQHQDLSSKYREKSLTWVGIEPMTSGLDHCCSTD